MTIFMKMTNYNLINKNKILINYNALLNKNFIHTTGIIYSNYNSRDINRILEESSRLEELSRLEEASRLENVRISNLELVKYSTTISKEDSSDIGVTPYNELFPWLIDDEGNVIDVSNSINVYDGVKIVSRYLETKYNMNRNIISEAKISEMLNIFNNEKDVTVYQLYKHVGTLYNSNKDNFKSNIIEVLKSGEDVNVQSLVDVTTESSKPLGNFGELKLNEIITRLRDLNWDFNFNNTEVSISAIPAAVSFVSYSFMVKTYIKHVHNRPYDLNMNNAERSLERISRRRQLAFFTLIGAPTTLIILNLVAGSYKDIISIKFLSGRSVNENKIGFFLLLSNLNKKIPEILTIIKMLIFIILVLKILGIGIIEFLTTWYYLKIYFWIGCSTAILLESTDLILLHLFLYKKITISEVLPDFLINKLKYIENTSLNKMRVKGFKEGCYIQLSIYTVLLIMLIIFG